MIKKGIVLSALYAGLSAAYAAPMITGNALTLEPSATGAYTVDFSSDATDTVTSGQFRVDFPSEVTVNSVTSSDAARFNCQNRANAVVCILSADPAVGRLPDTTSFLSVNLTAGTTEGSFSPTIAVESYNITKGASNLAAITVKSATTAPTTYTVSYSTTGTGTGSFSCAVEGTNIATGADVEAGKVVSCTATANSDSELASVTGATLNAGNYEVTVNSDATIVATFNKKAVTPTTLSVTLDSTITNGQISCGTGVSGDTVTCTATPNTGYKFVNWSGACTGSGACTVTLPNATPLGAMFSLLTTTPTTTSTAQPVPAVGLLGLLGMLASLMGAAGMVLRRKSK